MSKRNDIITSFIAHIATNTGYTGYRGLRFLHEINTFPSFYVHARNESRQHLSNGAKLAVLAVDIRGYGWSEGLSYIETIVRDLEQAIQTFRASHISLVHEARTIQLRTDEGLMEPYCVCDMSVEILYGINDD